MIQNPFSSLPLGHSENGGVFITLPLRFHAFHGVLPQEREVGGDFRITLRLSLDEKDVHRALCHDELDGTINYAEVFEAVQKEMCTPSALLENVAHRIARTLIRRFDTLRQVDVSVTKVTPPITGYDGDGITVSHTLRRQLVAWDFDGTIADTSLGIVRTMTATFKRLGLPVPTDKAIKQTIGLPLRQGIAQLARIEGERLTDAENTYRELFEQIGTEGVTLFAGVKEEMRRLHESGRFVGIATSRGHESVASLCEMLGIRSYIDYIVACEDVSVHKPHPAPVFRLCELAHVLPQDTTVIGDTTFDIEMGCNAGATHVVGVGWGNHSIEMLKNAGATEIVEAFN